MKFDLHIHTKYSPKDGYLEPDKCIRIAKKRGFSGIAITDHNTIKGALAAKKILDDKNFQVIVGSEIKTARGEIIGLFLEDEITSKDPVEVVEKIREQNGISIIPHPFDKMRKTAFFPTSNDVKLIDAVEIINARCVDPGYNKMASEFAVKHDLGMCGGSDAHFANEIGNAGIITRNPDIREAILKKEVEVFLKSTSIFGPGLSKGLKLWRKLKSR
jgi:predicted metal-dependent phosphoesterase TrpH